MTNEELQNRLEVANEQIDSLRNEVMELRQKIEVKKQKFTKVNCKQKRVYEPRDGSKSDWAKTPEGIEWFNRNGDGMPWK